MEQGDTLAIISVVTLDEAPAVDINDLTFHSPVAPEHIKSADRLSKTFTDFSRPNFLLSGQARDDPEGVRTCAE
jgi:hypothetical protein